MGKSVSLGLSLHIPAMVVLQMTFLVLFGVFTRYDPNQAYRNQYENEKGVGSKVLAHEVINSTYAMFQDVHVMIFIGFGFLMTFLKKYGLSAVSLNMLCSVLAIQWGILVYGFLHPSYDLCAVSVGNRSAEDAVVQTNVLYNTNCYPNFPWIDISLGTMLDAEFAVAAVLISFGVLLGTTSPLQLIFMTLIEIVLFNVNKIIGRSYLGAVDAGDTIFVHMFGAFFGLAISRVLYDENAATSPKASTTPTSDLFSMIGTVFMWMFWPSFNAVAAAEGDAKMRALINTYLSLCACVMASFAASAVVNPKRKFAMEHIQNATLAGGIAVGAIADMVITPFGAALIGTCAGVFVTLGFQYLTPFVASKLKINDTCGVLNLHGMTSIFGGLLSVLFSAIASQQVYDQFNSAAEDPALSSFHEIFPGGGVIPGGDWSPAKQAGVQAAAISVTLGIAIGGGLVTGILLRMLGKLQTCADAGNKATQGNVSLPVELLFDDEGYIYNHEEDEEDEKTDEAMKGKENNNYSSDLV